MYVIQICMKNFYRRIFCLAISVCTVFTLSVSAISQESIENDNDNIIFLNTPEDWEQMRENDLAEYNEKLSRIDPELKKDVNDFLSYRSELSPLGDNSITQTMEISNATILNEFLDSYPKYEDMSAEIAHDVEMLRFNPVVEAIRSYFSKNGYELSLDLFNHSLTENPEDARMTLTGNTGGMYDHLRSELTNDPFFDKMVAFSQKNDSFESITDWSHTFENGDLKFSIHGFTWTRVRSHLGYASFAIEDVYDFDPHSIPGIAAGFAGTNEFNIYIGGAVLDGEII